jgi:predicted S18 family serine protease
MEALLNNIEVIEALEHNSNDVSELVKSLLLELSPSAKEEIEGSSLENLTKDLLNSSKIWAFLAKKNETFIGVITLHECAAIYAGGVFGEISELYVKP